MDAEKMKLNFTYPMHFVMLRAGAESAALRMKQILVEHVFMGLAKLAEIDPADIAAPSHDNPTVRSEMLDVVELFKSRRIDTKFARQFLRRTFAVSYGETLDAAGRTNMEEYLSCLKAMMERDNQQAVTAQMAFQAIIENPPPVVRELMEKCNQPGGTPSPTEVRENTGAVLTAGNTAGAEFVTKLVADVRRMQYTLLDVVFGQDHAVHAFAEGIFNSELLTLAEDKRTRPRAIFIFTGPPGVGKTYLAEKSAEILNIPFKRFDMSGYSDIQQHLDLVGFPASFKDAKEGQLTGFVRKNPHCILLFDEIEKAHLNCINLFLQILDAGRLQDKYSEKEVSFRDTLIIFTTNAGRQLYQDKTAGGGESVSRKTILNALETDMHPGTGQPFFPAAICSRLATGWPIMFNHLQAHDLERIAGNELTRCGNLFARQFGLSVGSDPLLPSVLLFREGGSVDARTLRAQTEIFFKSEMYKLFRLMKKESTERFFKEFSRIRFTVEIEKASADASALFLEEGKPEILLFAGSKFAEICRTKLSNYVWHDTLDYDYALKLLGEHDIRLVLIPPLSDGIADSQIYVADTQLSVKQFDLVPIGAGQLAGPRIFFRSIRERLPEIPVYLLEMPGHPIDEEVETSFMRGGARGKIVFTETETGVFEEALHNICRSLSMQKMASSLAASSQVLRFETTPKMDRASGSVLIRLRDLNLKRALAAGDTGNVLDDVQKPKTSFKDVIGADSAKDELNFFIDYLKYPKKFAALGLKPPKGVLLHGPPGTGKTLLARAMAGESNMAFIPSSASSFVTKWQGSGPESIRKLFETARRYAPSIIFIDEIDAIGRTRGGSNSGHGEEMALNALLTEMDGFSVDLYRPVFVLAATNFEVDEGSRGACTLDAALVRRFDRKIFVDLPDKNARLKYLKIKLSARSNSGVSPEMIEQMAGRTVGMSLANLESVIELAARNTAKSSGRLDDQTLENALEIIRHGEEKSWGGHANIERIARHESGHAFMYWRAGHTPAYVTIVGRRDHGGYMEHSCDEASGPVKTREEMIGDICTAIAGRAAEIVYYGEEGGVSMGGGGDLQKATETARSMICSYGMDEAIGMISMSYEEATRGPMAARINERISKILDSQLRETIKAISAGLEKVDILVSKLLEKNRMTGEEIKKILGENHDDR